MKRWAGVEQLSRKSQKTDRSDDEWCEILYYSWRAVVFSNPAVDKDKDFSASCSVFCHAECRRQGMILTDPVKSFASRMTLWAKQFDKLTDMYTCLKIEAVGLCVEASKTICMLLASIVRLARKCYDKRQYLWVDGLAHLPWDLGREIRRHLIYGSRCY